MLKLLLLLASLQAADQDVIRLKDGTTRSGRIVSETKDEVVLETLIKGAKGQVVGTAKVTVAQKDVDHVDRTTPETRRQAEERSKSFGERGIRRMEALWKISPEPQRFQGLQGYRVTGTRFVLDSSCDPAFVKDAALCLEEIFGAYERSFGIRHSREKKVKVYLFADRLEYEFYNLHAVEGKVSAVAYYCVPENTIAGYNLIEREKEQVIRADILAAQQDVERFRTQVQAVEKQILAMVPEIKQKILEEMADLRRLIRADGQGNLDKRLYEIELMERKALNDLKEGKTTAQGELQDLRRRATQEIEKGRQIIEKNENVIFQQNLTMFETLFHEGFHAFASNYLWEGSGKKEFPRWLHEGMACYYEAAVVDSGTLIHGAPHPAFLNLLREKLVLRTTLPLEKILLGGPEEFTLTHSSDGGRRTQYYAQSWALAHYLSGRISKDQIEAYVVDVVGGKDPVESFERMMGRKCATVETELKAHLESLK